MKVSSTLPPVERLSFSDSRPPDIDPQTAAMTRTPPPNYVVLRTGSQTPERFPAGSDEEAMAILQRQVRKAQAPIVYLYKLICAEAFVASSETLTLNQIKERLAQNG